MNYENLALKGGRPLDVAKPRARQSHKNAFTGVNQFEPLDPEGASRKGPPDVVKHLLTIVAPKVGATP